MKRHEIWGPALLMFVAASGCERGAAPSVAGDETSGVTSEAPAAPSDEQQTHVAQGTINRIDREQGRVNISHEAVASTDWPAMTMDFELADPDAAGNVKEGDRVSFQFRKEPDGRAVISKIEAAN